MSDEGVFSRIIELMQEAALDQERWPSVAALIDEFLEVEGNSVVSGSGQTSEVVRISFAGVYLRGQRHRDLERLYFEHYHAIDERLPRVRLLPHGEPTQIQYLYTAEELKTSVAYNEGLPRGKAQDCITLRLDGPQGSRIVWQIHDPVGGDGWTSKRIDRIRSLVPHMVNCWNVREVLAGMGALGGTLLDLLELSGFRVIQLSRTGEVLAASDSALELLRERDGLVDSDGRLSARVPDDDAALQKALADVLPGFRTPGVGGFCLVRRSTLRPPLVVHAVPVSPRVADDGARHVAALVLVVDPVNHDVVDEKVVSEVLGLTPMEARVAGMLAGGMSVRQIAKALHRSESTIRTHVKHKFVKLGVSRQAELVRLVRSLVGRM